MLEYGNVFGCAVKVTMCCVRGVHSSAVCWPVRPWVFCLPVKDFLKEKHFPFQLANSPLGRLHSHHDVKVYMS